MTPLRVAILTPPRDSANAADRADTFVQAAEIDACLTRLGHSTVAAEFSGNRVRASVDLAALKPSLVFNLVEDVPEGPDKIYFATEVLDALHLPFTGASTHALKDLGDKRLMRESLRQAALPIAPGFDEGAADTRFIVKSAIEHASIGIGAANVVTGREAAVALIEQRTKEFGGVWFAETYIEGREFNVAVLDGTDGAKPLPVAEILFLNHDEGRPKVLGYAEKWAPGTAAYDETPRTFPHGAEDAPLLIELQRLALAAWRVFSVSGYARIDFRVDVTGRPFILEVNANPCLSADAGFCAAAAEAGLSQTDVVDAIIKAALARAYPLAPDPA